MVNLLSVVRTIWMFNIDKVQHGLNQSVASSRSLELLILRIHWSVKIPQKMRFYLFIFYSKSSQIFHSHYVICEIRKSH